MSRRSHAADAAARRASVHTSTKANTRASVRVASKASAKPANKVTSLASLRPRHILLLLAAIAIGLLAFVVTDQAGRVKDKFVPTPRIGRQFPHNLLCRTRTANVSQANK